VVLFKHTRWGHTGACFFRHPVNFIDAGACESEGVTDDVGCIPHDVGVKTTHDVGVKTHGGMVQGRVRPRVWRRALYPGVSDTRCGMMWDASHIVE